MRPEFHGTSITGLDDRDEIGPCLEPWQFVTGLARVPNGVAGLAPSVRFEQYERHTAWDRPGRLADRSGAGDLDVIIYSARKWARLAWPGTRPCCWCCSSPTLTSSSATRPAPS